MELYTGSYGAYSLSMGQAVVTSLLLPRWLPEAASWPRCWVLTPTWQMFHAEPDVFEREYLARLDRFGAPKIGRALHAIARETGAGRLVLLCYEPLTGCSPRPASGLPQ